MCVLEKSLNSDVNLSYYRKVDPCAEHLDKIQESISCLENYLKRAVVKPVREFIEFGTPAYYCANDCASIVSA